MKKINEIDPESCLNYIDAVFLSFMGTTTCAEMTNSERHDVIYLYNSLIKHFRKQLFKELDEEEARARAEATT